MKPLQPGLPARIVALARLNDQFLEPEGRGHLDKRGAEREGDCNAVIFHAKHARNKDVAGKSHE